jgi:MoxR-like ATPase
MSTDESLAAQSGQTISAEELASVHEAWQRLRAELRRVVVGQDELIEQLVILVLSRGHGVIMGLPGVAKFSAVAGLAQALGLVFHRVRCTPDLTPEDVISGADVPVTAERASRDRSSLLLANVLLADDIDRLPPKTTSILHHAMQDQEVIIGGQRRPLPVPFVLLATRHPREETADIPYEPRDDRFMFEIRVRYPDYEADGASCGNRGAGSRSGNPFRR